MGAPPIQLANLGMADSLILMILALVVFGPRRLPQIGRQIGKLMYEFRKASNDFKYQMEEELRMSEEADRKRKEEAQRQATLTASTQASPEAVSAPANYPYQEEEPVVTPRIMPPSTGETVSAARPSAPAAESDPAVEANLGAETSPAEPPTQTTPTEPVSQHG